MRVANSMRTLLGAGGSDRHRRWRSVSALHTSETSVDEAQSICKRNTRSATVASCSPAFPAKPPKRPAPAPAASAPVPVLHISRIGARTAPTGDGARVAVPASSWPARRSHWPMEADESSRCAARGAPPALLPLPRPAASAASIAPPARRKAWRSMCASEAVSGSPSASESRCSRHRNGACACTAIAHPHSASRCCCARSA